MSRKLIWAGIALLVILIGIQLIPIDRTNPPVTREVKWDSPQTRDLTKRACFDCHSNETVWPWDSYIAPFSLIIYNHVVEGRGVLNFSAWDRSNARYEELEELTREGEMPPWDYLVMHPEARLIASEQGQLLAGLQKTFQQDPPISRR